MLRRYAPAFFGIVKLRVAPAAQNVLDAIEVIRTLNAYNWNTVYLDRVWRNRVKKKRGNSDHSEIYCFLSVRFFPFSEAPQLGTVTPLAIL